MSRGERIACAAWALNAGNGLVTTIVVPNKKLPMDYYNELRKSHPHLKILPLLYYITNQGNVVDEVEAWHIAFEANQFVGEITDKTRLTDRKSVV